MTMGTSSRSHGVEARPSLGARLIGGQSRLALFFETVKFEHTIFALPFAYVAMFLAADGLPSAADFAWITVAMVSARTFGMAANRLIDAEIDARNPRTASRPLPTGRVSYVEVGLYTAVSAVVFIVAAFQFGSLARSLWPVVLVAMAAYPYGKRFTWASHLALGLVYVIVPTGVWVAIHNEVTGASLALGLAAGCWVAGFDIIYACQDVDVDRRDGLHSLPADMGVAPALIVARVLHALMLAALVVAGWSLERGVWYYVGIVVTGLLLAYEHRLVSPRDLSRVNAAFFTTNGVISLLLLGAAMADTIP
jgi:4-hydroxybenzoate polyprenyltransferase